MANSQPFALSICSDHESPVDPRRRLNGDFADVCWTLDKKLAAVYRSGKRPRAVGAPVKKFNDS